MKTSLCFLFVFVVLFSSVLAEIDYDREFKQFMKTYNKAYATEEEYNLRFNIFRDNLLASEEKDAEDPLASWGVTKFSDLTKEEFASIYLMKKFTSPKVRGENIPVWQNTLGPMDYPTEYDWRKEGSVVTPVYNQKQCGSCWAFSATENMESMWARANNSLISLSMQQIVDCDKTDGGCGGGDPTTAYEYIEKAGGLELFKDYPYTGKNGKCVFDSSKVAASIHNWTYITKDDNEEDMMAFTFTQGPPSICVDASSWSDYKGGVITKCGMALDHCVQIVGWSVQSGVKAWTVRNSWGEDWGPYGGYLYLAYGSNVCGLGKEVTSTFA